MSPAISGSSSSSTKYTDYERELTRLLETASALTGISFSFERGETLPAAEPPGWSQLESQLRLALTERVARPYRVDAISDFGDFPITVELPEEC